MKKKRLIIILIVIASLIVGLTLSILYFKNANKIERPDFSIVLKESIYIEYEIDPYDDSPLHNVIETSVINMDKSKIPDNATYTYEIDNSEISFDYNERARALNWDIEGTRMFGDTYSVGAIIGFWNVCDNNPLAIETLAAENIEAGLEKAKTHKGSFTITIGDFSETYDFDYYVIKVTEKQSQ